MHRTLSRGTIRSMSRPLDRVSRAIERAQKWPSRRLPRGALTGRGARRARAHTPAGIALIALLVVIVIAAAIATTVAIAGIDPGFVGPASGLPATLLPAMPRS